MNENQQQPPMNGNDDLAKTLNEGLQFEETPMGGAAPATPPAPDASTPPADTPPSQPADTDDDMPMPSIDPSAGDPDNEPMPSSSAPTLTDTPPVDEPAPQEDASPKPADEAPAVHHPHAKNHDKPNHTAKTSNGDLDGLKASALEELRPLVGKLNLPADERFDTLLLIIRSTDDQSLLDEAHAAAKEIKDDTRRAQALLDVIKEIDYFSSKR